MDHDTMTPRVANALQGTITHTHTRTYTRLQSMDNLEMPISLQRMRYDWRRKPEWPEKTPKLRREHVTSTHTGQRRELRLQLQRCEANVLTTKPPLFMRMSKRMSISDHYEILTILKDPRKLAGEFFL
ncbi:hypothetical protein AMELA_G00031420 [Ameiurus melas]|uniref:Uncharacterized protein n=1 Tax=Ameiurus melas TaxID=219545 RepID=A0A7J6B962_AMEME|nr:hypothetical protein AMELA_G00031420 [Ameiurus melas]